jgi:hypothetical protein
MNYIAAESLECQSCLQKRHWRASGVRAIRSNPFYYSAFQFMRAIRYHIQDYLFITDPAFCPHHSKH